MIVPLSITTEKRKVGVLTPKEKDMIMEKLNDKYKIRTNFLLHTAMRITEARYVMNHPECFRKENGAIFLPQVKGMGKTKSTIKNRQIMLSTKGIQAVNEFLKKRPGLSAYQDMEEVYKRAARDAGFDDSYITTKLWRKSLISWLMCIYPEKQSQIAFSAGHNYNTMRVHYLTYGWRKEDIKDMREELTGWGEA